MAELSEAVIARRLWSKYGYGQWACANMHYYAFESDLLILRKSGTVVEYEIKLSVSDYNAGLRKKQVINPHNKNCRQNKIWDHQKYTTRHQYLQNGMGANMFYYVAPEEVLEQVDIPEWAGVIAVEPNRTQDSCGSWMIKKAPFLHKDEPSKKLKEKILTSCYYKYWQHFAVKDLEGEYA